MESDHKQDVSKVQYVYDGYEEQIKDLEKRWLESGIVATFNPDKRLLFKYLKCKKTVDKAFGSLCHFAELAHRADFATADFDIIEKELLARSIVLPYPAVNFHDGNPILFFNSERSDPGMVDCIPGAVDGISLIGEATDIGWSKFYPEVQQGFMSAIGNCLPVRIKQMRMVDPPIVARMIFKLISPFMSSKMRNRMKFVSGKDILKEVDNANLPYFLGGECFPDVESFVPILREYFEEFKSFMTVNPRDTSLDSANGTHWAPKESPYWGLDPMLSKQELKRALKEKKGKG